MYQKDLIPSAEVKLVKNWFEYLIDEDDDHDPHDTKYRCRICTSFKDQVGLKKGVIMPDIGKPEGILKPTMQENRDEIIKHKSSPVHNLIINQLMKRKRVELQDLSHYSNRRITPGNEVTNRVMRSVYIAIKNLHASYNNLPYIVR